MKNLLYILLLSPLFFISSCEEEEETQSGYNCISNTCSAVFENPQYLTLSDCQSVCGENNTGGENIEIGAIYQGGLVFYVDGTGEHGLVAAMEDLDGFYEWGCYPENVNGADGQAIGTGYQNTLDIVSGCSETPIAASEALAYESGGYSDWYLPSIDELLEMYNTLGNGGPVSNIGGFGNYWYWSSSEDGNNSALLINFNSGYPNVSTTNYTYRVRIIRAF